MGVVEAAEEEPWRNVTCPVTLPRCEVCGGPLKCAAPSKMISNANKQLYIHLSQWQIHWSTALSDWKCLVFLFCLHLNVRIYIYIIIFQIICTNPESLQKVLLPPQCTVQLVQFSIITPWTDKIVFSEIRPIPFYFLMSASSTYTLISCFEVG